MADVKNTTESRGSRSQLSARMRSRPGKRDQTSSTSGQAHSFKQDQLSHPSLRRLQAKMEAENQQVQQLIQPILDTKNGFIKELESFLNQQDVAKLRRRELLHKDWTEHVWIPLQRSVEERVSSCSPVEVNRRQSLNSDNLHHCQSKLKTPYFKETLDIWSCERQREKKISPSLQTGNKCTWRKRPELSFSLDKCALTQASHLPQASSHHPASTSIKILRKDETKQKTSSRLDTIPCHIDATSDGRCHQSSCFFSTQGCYQQPKSLQQINLIK